MDATTPAESPLLFEFKMLHPRRLQNPIEIRVLILIGSMERFLGGTLNPHGLKDVCLKTVRLIMRKHQLFQERHGKFGNLLSQS